MNEGFKSEQSKDKLFPLVMDSMFGNFMMFHSLQLHSKLFFVQSSSEHARHAIQSKDMLIVMLNHLLRHLFEDVNLV
jgi:hypothetical protein